MINEQKFTCLDCGQEFEAPKFRCERTGRNHRVVRKEYFVESPGLIVHWKTDETYPVHEGGGKLMNIVGRHATATRGVISSEDPEEQMFFDTYKGCITRERWEQIHIPATERKAAAERDATRLESQRNELLEEIAKLKKEQATARAANPSQV